MESLLLKAEEAARLLQLSRSNRCTPCFSPANFPPSESGAPEDFAGVTSGVGYRTARAVGRRRPRPPANANGR